MIKKAYLAEAFATFALVFASAGAVVIDEQSGGTITHVGCALAAGLVVMTMIYAVGDVSGAHLNPAVTIGFYLSRRLPGSQVPGYVTAQFGGSLIAAALLAALFGTQTTLGATVPAGPVAQSFVLEIVLTCFLMFVILAVATGAKEKGLMAGAAIGGVVALNCLWAGPISGASMNPARSLGPALFGGQLQHLWLYFAAPIVGAALAVLICKLVHEPGACCVPQTGEE